ncbi:MAG TPA: hypothetical protein VIG90_02795 [Pedomonas sp.]|uniref:hypothetical protein n=1 Tax=Pedomonas sp. TaxID=2976421 RepID=UPI002F42D53C
MSAQQSKDAGFRSEIAGAVHEMMRAAHDAGVVSPAALHTFEEAWLAPARPSAACPPSSRKT